MAEAVGIVCHPRIDIGGPPVMEARRRLEQRGYRVWTYCATAEERPGALVDTLDGTRLIVSIGGDGTLLWTAQQAAAARLAGAIPDRDPAPQGGRHPDVRRATECAAAARSRGPGRVGLAR